MIYNKIYKEVDESQEHVNFRFANSSVFFSLLSDSLYSNKIGSIVRELSSNAYDSHVQAGKAHVPFEIEITSNNKILSDIQPTFSIIDHGTGLSEEDIYKIYTVYGESSKRDSNDFIGGFGLGSKSPFAYTKSFVVVSCYNGKETSYCAFIDASGCPAISKMYERETNDSNGLKVSFNIQETDVLRFIKEIRNQLKFFKVKPLTNFYVEWHELKDPIIENSDFTLRSESQYCLTKFYVNTGNIVYEIDMQYFPNRYISGSFDVYLNTGIGVIDLNASRENISYTKRTIKIIKDLLDEYNEAMDVYFEDYIKSHTYWEASLHFRKYHFSLPDKYKEYYSITINKEEIVDFCNKNNVKIYFRKKSAVLPKTIGTSFSSNSNIIEIYPESLSFYTANIKSFYNISLDQINKQCKPFYNIFIVSLDEDKIKEVLDKFFHSPSVEKLDFKPRAITEKLYKYKKITQIKRSYGSNSHVIPLQLPNEYIEQPINDIKDELESSNSIVFVVSNGFTVDYDNYKQVNYYDLMRLIIEHSNLFHDYTIYFFFKTTFEALKKIGYVYNESMLFDTIQSKLKLTITDETVDIYNLYSKAPRNIRYALDYISTMFSTEEIEFKSSKYWIFELALKYKNAINNKTYCSHLTDTYNKLFKRNTEYTEQFDKYLKDNLIFSMFDIGTFSRSDGFRKCFLTYLVN